MKWIEELVAQHRIPTNRTLVFQNPLHPEQQLVYLFLELETPVTVVMTTKLSEYTMPVSEKWKGREHNELFFCLPTYWDFEDHTNPNSNWIFEWLFRLENFVYEKNTWLGPGHSIPCGNPPTAISSLMKQEYFMFFDPMFLSTVLAPLTSADKTIYFLSIVPIFGDELDYKMGKGTHNIVKKFMARKTDERLDDYRFSVLRSRFRMF